eukprot:CAMPEP_0182435984 /NCGR_PEP_ID=MMETSP1167-20130531/78801_1 /TAXON_ID=2988 /ORGANISM="Mallomonas Sp, Strain CCMP3275" /LENGTH=644 /DNA_ID=CAMNT_0024627621 /DNA_START=11 /DNA_END=1945 /DNA_ORIENTATION=-
MTSKMNYVPVPIERELELQEVVMKSMGPSIKKIERKIHDAELFMHYQPTDIVEYKASWQGRLDALLHEEKVNNFPTIIDIRRDWKKQHPEPVVLSTGEVLDKKKEIAQEAARKAKKLARNIQKKSLSRLSKSREEHTSQNSSGLGRKPEGEVLRTIPNYYGVNTAVMNQTRVLKRIQGGYVGHMFPNSSLPPWIEPGHYHREQDSSLLSQSPGQFNVPFKTTERGPLFPVSEEEKQRPCASTRRRPRGGVIEETDDHCIPHYMRQIHTSAPDLNRSSSNPSADVSPWSNMSPASTIGLVSPIAGPRTSHSFKIGPLSHTGGEWVDDDKSKFLSNSDFSSLFSTFTPKSAVEVDDLIVNMKKLEDRKYRVKDFTRGALADRCATAGTDDVRSRPEMMALLQTLEKDPAHDDSTSTGSVLLHQGNAGVDTAALQLMYSPTESGILARRSSIVPVASPQTHSSSPPRKDTAKKRETPSYARLRAVDKANQRDKDDILLRPGSPNPFLKRGSLSTSHLSPSKIPSTSPSPASSSPAWRRKAPTPLANNNNTNTVQSLSPVMRSSRGRRHRSPYDANVIESLEVDLKGLLLAGPGVNVDGMADKYSPRVEDEKENHSVSVREGDQDHGNEESVDELNDNNSINSEDEIW